MKNIGLIVLFATALLLTERAWGQGTGLTGKYYEQATFTNLVTTRTDGTINFDWGTNAPAGTAITNGDTFSVSWTGQIEPEFTELYTFYVTADDAAKLWVEDRMIVGRSFYVSPSEMRGQMQLKAGHRVNVRLEYFENSGNASVKLEWASPSQPRQVIPTARLYPATEIPNGGSLLREVWTNLPGASLSALTNSANYPSRPASRELLTSFECLATNWEDSFGTRVTGYLRAPTNGNYTFAVSGDEVVQLFLSPNTNPSAKLLIASATNATGFRDWSNQVGQISAPIALAAGQRCYVELLHKEDTGADHWSVGWMKPGETTFSIVPGTVLMMPGTEAATPSSSALFNTLVTEHPYLGVSRERFLWLRQQYTNTASSAAKSRAQAVVSSANNDLIAALQIQRQGQDAIQRLAFAWWMTGDSKYAERAWEFIGNAITNGDWTQPWCGCEDGLVAMGYDWLFPYWSQARKDTMVNAMVTKGFGPGWTTSYVNNIGVLINAGHLMACLAVGMTNEAAAEPKVSSAIGRLAGMINEWEPNAGAWVEGTCYGILAKWDLGQAMSSMEMALGSTWALSRVNGLWTAAREPLEIASNTRDRFTFADIGTPSEGAIGWANWWARRYNALEVFDYSRQIGNSPLNALTLPETTLSPAAVGRPPDTCFEGPAGFSLGDNWYQHVITLRENWTNSKATFVGCKGGGYAYSSHTMLDGGTFQLVARGLRWFHDLSSQNYDSPNHNVLKPNPNGIDRWDYYRNRAEGHNTLVINPSAAADRTIDNKATLINYQSAPNGTRSFGIYDLTPTITGATRVQRGFQLLGNRHQVLVQDEIVMPSASTVWWFAHFLNTSTTAAIGSDGTTVTLSQGAERLWCKIVSGGGTWAIRSADPFPTTPTVPNDSNTNYSKLAINLTGVTNTTLAVWFVPLASGEVAPTNSPALLPLRSWDLVAQNEPPTVRDGVALSTNNQPVDVELRNFVSDDWTHPHYLTYAVSNAQGGTVTLLADGHTARFSPLANATSDLSFNFTATDEGGLISVPATVTIGVPPVTYAWTNLAGGNWSAAANWSNGVAPSSSHGTRLEFFSGTALGGITNAAVNDLGPLSLNSLTLAGSGTNANVITLAGAPLALVPNGFTPPSVTLAAFTAPVSYLVSNAITLADDTTFFANNTGTFNFAGPIGGSGGLVRSNTYSTLILSGYNSYAGPTTILGGTLQIGNGGASGTLGLGEVLNNGSLRLARAGTLAVPNDISGTGSLVIAGPTANDLVTLSGNNSFAGAVTVNSGLRITDASQLGAGAKNISVAGVNGTLRFDGSAGDITLPAEFSIFTSNPSGNGALLNEAGDNTIVGNVTLTSGAGSSRFTLSNGTLTILGNVAPNVTGRSLELRGPANGFIFGNVTDGPGTNFLTGLTKNDAGSWTLSGSNAYAGATVVNGGSLIINGSLTSPANATVGGSGRLAGSGVIAANTAVLGLLAPGDAFGTMTLTSNLTFGLGSRLQTQLGGNSLADADLVVAAAVTVTNGAKVDVLLNSPGSTANFLHAFWRTNRSWPALNAAAITGAFALGTNSTDAGGRSAATYGSFSLANTSTNVSLRWTALPGFPVINDPIVTITSPANNPCALPTGVFSLRVVANVNNNGGTNVVTRWTVVSAPDGAAAIFANANATSTTVSFSDEGDYRLRLTAANEVGAGYAELLVTVTANPPWHQTLITFTNYARPEPLTNFPALISFGTNVPGFDYGGFLAFDGSDLRIFSADGATELNYEIDTWNPAGLSRVWVQVPVLTNNTAILARWGDPAAADAPGYASNGSTWSNGFIGVWHLNETSGQHLDSSPNLATSRVAQVTAQGTVPGIVGSGDNFNGTNEYVSLPDLGTNAHVTVECWANLNAVPSGNDIGLVSSDPWSAGITHWKTDSSLQIKAQINGGGTVNSATNLLPVGSWFYAAYTVAGNGTTDFKTWFNASLIGSAAGLTNNVLTDLNLAREYNGRYLNARMDEVRLSSVARSSNWLWATYQTIASNAAFTRYDAVYSPTNHPPAFTVISNRTIGAGQWLYVTNAATDPEAPPQTLTFSLINPPAGALLDPDTGVFAWRVPVALAGTTHTITTLVSDNGSPSLSATQSFNAIIRPLTNPPAMNQLRFTNGAFALRVTGEAGLDYTLQASTNFSTWTNLFGTNSPTLPLNWTDTNASRFRQRFYRLLLGP